ncbi:Ig-like domain-containing protein [Brevibacillus migulae]|uniref:Ig-like domain-containing protein n=1 Tax=Brevibacillus migulae TaxID=1644114 RepID=UPI00106E7434|nr:Ig-like domain-containing protein [Brevibacillus migulae]
MVFFLMWKKSRVWVGVLALLLVVQMSASALGADRKPPSMQVTPKNGASEVPVKSAITVTYSEQVKLADGSAITSKNAPGLFIFTQAVNGETIAATVSWSSEKKRITITPKQPLLNGTTYRLLFPANRVKDRSNNPNEQMVAQFRTEEIGPPLQAAITPEHLAQNVAVDASIKLTFNKPVTRANHQELSNGAVDKIVKLTDEKGKKISFRGTWDEKLLTATIDPEGNLAAGVTYTFTLLEKKVMDRQGVKNEEITHQFTTRKQADTIAPTASIHPGHGAANVATDAKITLLFGEEITHMDGTPLSSKTVGQLVGLYDAKGTAIAYRATWNKSKKTVTIQAKGKLQPNTVYTIVLPANQLKDRSGNANIMQQAVFSTGRS